MTDEERAEQIAADLEARLGDRMVLSAGAVPMPDAVRTLMLAWHERIPYELRQRGHHLAELQVEISTRFDRIAWSVAGPTDATHSALLALVAGEVPDENLDPLAEAIDSLHPAYLGMTAVGSADGVGLDWRIYHDGTMVADHIPAAYADRKAVLGWAVRANAQATVRVGGSLTDDPTQVSLLIPVGGDKCVEQALSLVPTLGLPFPPEAASAALLDAPEIFVNLQIGPEGVARVGLLRHHPDVEEVVRMTSATGGAEDHKIAGFEALLDSDGPALLELALTATGWESACIYALPTPEQGAPARL